MHRRSFVIATAVAVAAAATAVVLPATAAEKKPLELFGVALKASTRDQLRQAFKENGL